MGWTGWIFFMCEWKWAALEVYFGCVWEGGHILWVGGGEWR